MLRKISLFLFSLLLLAVIYPTYANAQESSEYNAAISTYNNSIEKYNTSHGTYVFARSQYLKFKTLTSKNEAKEATRTMLEDRDQVIIDYLTAMKVRVGDSQGMSDEKKATLTGTLDEHISFFNSHKGRLVGAGSLEDLVDDSAEAGQYWSSMQPFLYLVLSETPYARIVAFNTRINENLNKIKDKVERIRNEERDEYKLDTRKLERVDRWIFETEDRIRRGEEKQNNVVTTISQIGATPRSNNKALQENVVSQLSVSLQDFQESSLFLKEIIRELVTK